MHVASRALTNTTIHGLSLAERLEFYSIPEPNSGCWLWFGIMGRHGYGRVTWRGKLVAAHRASWEQHRGQIPAGMVVCHKCDVPACINPAHLFLGTHQENMADMKAKGRAKRGEGHRPSKLTADQVLAIRADQRSAKKTAPDYGISWQNVLSIRSRRTWAHIADGGPLANR